MPDEPALAELRAADPDDPAPFTRGERIWILRTYLLLRRAGVDCTLGETIPRRGTVVFHAKHRRRIRAAWRQLGDAVLVAARADSSPALVADFEIVQNGVYADERRCFQIFHWLQPGLLSRAPERGNAVAALAFKGYLENLDPAFQDPGFTAALALRGVRWETDAIPFAAGGTRSSELRWHDYSAVDAILAVRPPARTRHRDKPASKLVNAWRAGVPALLGPEPANRELRRSVLDYFEVESPSEALEALDRLRAEPGLYQRMVENGLRRASAFTDAALVQRWREVLDVSLPERLRDPRVGRVRALPLPLRAAVRRLGWRA